MKQYIFYTLEGFTYSPKENEIENCQILGCASGKNKEEARYTLEEDSPWIKDSGFDIKQAKAKQLLSKDNKRDINTILNYLMEKEFQNIKESEKTNNVIYDTLLRLKSIID